jgi:hypothetical protein
MFRNFKFTPFSYSVVSVATSAGARIRLRYAELATTFQTLPAIFLILPFGRSA